MPFFEDIGKKISNMSQSAVEKTVETSMILVSTSYFIEKFVNHLTD